MQANSFKKSQLRPLLEETFQSKLLNEADVELLQTHFDSDGIDLLKVLDEYRLNHDFIKTTKLVKEIAMKLELTHHIGDGLLPMSQTAAHGSLKSTKKPENY